MINGFQRLAAFILLFIGTYFSFSIDALPNLMTSHWIVIGTFDNQQVDGVCMGYDKDYFSGLGGEASIRPIDGQTVGGNRWRTYQPAPDRLNFVDIFGQNINCLAYAYSEFSANKMQQAVLKLGSDDGIKIWLNGELVINHHVHRAIAPDEDAVLVTLNSGVNRILVKLDQGTGDWGFVMRFRSIEDEKSDLEKTRLRGLNVNLSGNVISNGSITGYAMTVPSYYVSENIKAALYDIGDKLIAEKTVPAGTDFKFESSGLKPDLYYIDVLGNGKLKGLLSDRRFLVVGDIKKLYERYIKMAVEISKMTKYPESDFDIRATCLFLKEQIEGKMHSSLTTIERNLRAIYTISEINGFIKNNGIKMNGLNQRAYLSNIDDSFQPYSVYVPKTYDKNKKYSLLLCLHGFSGDDYDAANNVASYKPEDFIIAAPFGRGDVGYFGIGEQDVLDVMNLMKRNYNIDQDRVYITGWSMGGFGTWRIGQMYADNFAAMVPFCGWTGEEYLDNLVNLPVLIVHGTEDDVVSIGMDQSASITLKALGYNVKFDAVEGAGHSIWQSWINESTSLSKTGTSSLGASGPGKLLDYLRKYKRNPYPLSVNVHARYLRYGKQYWVRLLEFTRPDVPGSLKAKITDERHIGIMTDNVSAFMVDLTHPVLAKTGRIVLNINGSNVLSDAGKSSVIVVFSGAKNKFEISKDNKTSIISHDGGGIVDIMMKKMLIVYGTKKGNAEKKWKNFAEILSDLQENEKIGFGTKTGKYKIMTDKDFVKLIEKNDPNVWKTNLILLGSADENLIVEKLSYGLPVKFKGDDIEIEKKQFRKSGIIMTYPNPVNNSSLIGIIALPFSENQVYEYGKGLNLNMRMYNMTQDINGYVLPDVIIFKSNNVPASAGYFDYKWKNLKLIEQ